MSRRRRCGSSSRPRRGRPGLAIAHVSELRVRQLGRVVHVVANVCVPAELSLGEAHDQAEALRQRWLPLLPPGSYVDIHVDPYVAGQGWPHPEGE